MIIFKINIRTVTFIFFVIFFKFKCTYISRSRPTIMANFIIIRIIRLIKLFILYVNSNMYTIKRYLNLCTYKNV